MKISRLVIQTLVVVAAVISFVLSFFIWTNNARYQLQPKADLENKNISNAQAIVQKRDLYSPSQILWNNGKDIHMVYNNKHNLVNAVQKDMSSWKFGKVSVKSKSSVNEYKKFINSKKTLQLFYPSQMSVSYYGQILGNEKLTKEKKYMFNRVLFNLDKNDKNIYLGNDESHTIYKLKVNSGSSKNINKLLQKADVSLKVNLVINNKYVDVNYVDRVVLKPYSYLVTKQEDNSYISNLLGSTNISTRKTDNITTYSSSSYQRLTSDSVKNELTFYNDYSKQKNPTTKTQMLNRGLETINQINGPLSNAKLSYVDWKNKVFVYREYVEGFPTFEKSNFGAIKISFNKSEQVTQFSNKIIQVPVPSDQKLVTSKSTAELISDLKKAGYDTGKIEYIDLGYKWNEDTDNNKVIDLIPTYFIRVDGKWSTLQSLIGVSDQVGGE